MTRPGAQPLRRSRWRVAVLGALVVTAVLGLLAAGAYVLARQAIFGRLQERLERVAVHEQEGTAADRDRFQLVDEDGRPILGGLPPEASPGGGPFQIIRRSAALGSLAVLRLPAGGRIATPAEDSLHALSAFLWLLVGLTAAGGAVSLPAAYILAGRALRPLEDAVQERSEFVTRASHQLRTPLAAIRASAELGLDGRGLSPEQALRTILAQTGRMEALAERLTALARAEAAPAGRAPAADLRGVCADVATGLAPVAAAAGVLVTVQPGAAVWARAAPEEVADLLEAVLDNAIRFTGDGGTVRLRAGAAGRRVFVAVADEGPGIPAPEVAAVTRPFYQGRGAPGRHGLGLAIARGIAERRRGRLVIRPNVGHGTIVEAWFRRGRPPAQRPPAG